MDDRAPKTAALPTREKSAKQWLRGRPNWRADSQRASKPVGAAERAKKARKRAKQSRRGNR